MNPYRFPLTCDICGGEGMTTPNGVVAAYMGDEIRHSDPAICADNLARKKKELDKREKELNNLNKT